MILYYAALPSLSPVSSLGSRLTIVGVLGACAWPILHAAAPWLPEPLRFLLGWFVFTIGPGFVVAGGVSRAMRTWPRAIVVLAATPVLIDLLGRARLLALFPYVACACAGAALAAWRTTAVAIDPDAARDARHEGDYDSADLSWYAVVASEASHTVPTTASYYSGHRLNAAYFPHLVLAMIHRFWGVPILSIFFRYAWPGFVSLAR